MRRFGLRAFLTTCCGLVLSSFCTAQSLQFLDGQLYELRPAEETLIVRAQDGGDLLAPAPRPYSVVDDQCGCDTGSLGCEYSLFGLGYCRTAGDYLEYFFAGDGWKNKADDDDNNNFGFRTGANGGIALGDLRVRGQLGASYGAYDFHGREDVSERAVEQQVFITAGLYKRSDVCSGDPWAWGAVYDHLYGQDWSEDTEEIHLGQIRGLMGFAFTDYDELGVWGTAVALTDNTRVLGGGVPIRPTNQFSAYWKRNWEFGGDTTGYVGYADGNSDVVMGLVGRAPLSHRVALFGGATYFLPSTTGGDFLPNGTDNSYSEESWNVSFGVVFYPGAKAFSPNISGQYTLPLLPVADNGSFNVTAPAGGL